MKRQQRPIPDAVADFIYCGKSVPDMMLPGTLKIISDFDAWQKHLDNDKIFPLLQLDEYLSLTQEIASLHFVIADIAATNQWEHLVTALSTDENVVLCLLSSGTHPMAGIRRFASELMLRKINCQIIIYVESKNQTVDEQLIHFSAEAGALLLDGIGDGIWLANEGTFHVNQRVSGRTYLEVKDNNQFLNNTSFSILQATRTRISKTEYISCPSCGRTLFDLQETTSMIRAVTHHLKGIKIAIMGCIVNGPGEMADADFGYVGSGPGKITLYKGKEVVKRNVNSEVAVDELINLLKENEAWIEPV